MENELNKMFENGLSGLPTDISEVIKKTPWKETLKNISGAHLLTEDEANLLLAETAIIILGYESPEKFNENLINNVGLDFAKSEIVSKDIYEKILVPIDQKINPEAKKEATVGVISIPENSIVTPEVKTSINLDQKEPEESTKPAFTSTPNYSSYDSGKDPYREPIE